MDEKYLVAVASSDGIVVNSHFGKAGEFYIYEIGEDGTAALVERRHMQPVCSRGEHDDKQLSENLNRLRDCKYILVSRIGVGASDAAERMGLVPMELPGMIQDSLSQLITYQKIQRLFQ
ncbi:MAG: NifB/NifX family molybdenum-iron cluster-binding protein [Lachnospiraceae bacterium]